MSSGTIFGIIAVVLVAVLLAGVGLFFVLRDDGDDNERTSDRDRDTTTTADDTEPEETDPPETDPPETDPPETDPPETDPPDTEPTGPDDSHSGSIGPDGSDSFTADVVAGGDLLVVTPVGDWDLVLEISGGTFVNERVDSGLDGDSESIFLPEGSYTITVSGWLSDDFGGYTATLG